MKHFALGLFLFVLPSVAREYCSWDDAQQYFARHEVRLHLAGNARVEGAWVGVSPQMAKFYIEKTSNPTLYPKGLKEIPKAEILSADYRGNGEFGKYAGLQIATLLVPAIAFPATHLSEKLAVPAMVGTVAAGASTGHRLQRRWHKVVLIK